MKQKKKMGLTTQIFIGLFLGLFVGIVFNLFVPSSYIKDTILVNGVFDVLGQGFIRLMQMLVVPLVFFSLVTGAMSMGDTKKLGKIGVKTLVFYLFTTALAITLALLLASFIKPGVGIDLTKVSQTAEANPAQAVSLKDTVLNLIPTNPIRAMSEGNMLQIIFFALLVGIILANLGEKAHNVANIFEEFNDIMMDMTMIVMKFAPIGVFALIAKTFATLGLSAIFSMLKYMLTVVLGLGLQLFLVYMVLLTIFAKANPFKFLKKFFPVLGFAFSTSSSNATVPMNINKLEELGVSRKISSFTIPLGATINMDGTAIMQGVAVVFAANAYGMQLTPQNFLTVIAAATLASVGTAGIPSVGLITLSMVFNSIGLPISAIAMIMGIDRILDMIRTAINITGDAVCTVIVANSSGEEYFDRKKFNS
ncbi:dicarboxylate/amino acid:cation symporter [Finegoldia sp. BIOML-A1]|uniref:dicarboxylate/amino acid:cation symporter n=1 Tax=Finegoldia sp. BIOML-A1 TaxID=2584649 RepID=UPI0012AFF535|nr:dicarboxylate/amino acid:cation symporter [Finegoldia sp. BIOML-A1]MSB10347.1 cation:dicarboxylase symporter family transporter [Finegoldia sp. BIOML-A1]